MKPNQQRISGVDGLRAFAVLSVILFHLNHAYLPGGFVGVDVFFVISGYVVCGSLGKHSRNNFYSFIGDFYVRRLLRIYPALMVLLLAGGVLSTWFIPPSYLSENNAPTGLWAFFGLGNLALVKLHNNYFSVSNDYNPYAHTWSLGVEEQYYLVFPLLLFGLVRAGRFGAVTRFFIRTLLPALFVVSLVYSIRETQVRHDRAYFLLPSRFWELAAGALLNLAHHEGRLLPASAGQSANLILGGLATLLISDVFVNADYFPFPLAIPPVIGTCLCISGLVTPATAGFGARVLTLPLVVGLGRISYSVYLWHWVVIVLLRWTVGAETLAAHLLAVALTFCLAALSYYCLELPVQRIHSKLGQHTVLTLAGGGCAIVIGWFAFAKIDGDKIRHGMALSTVVRNRSDWYVKADNGTYEGPLLLGAAGKPWSGKRLFCIGDSHAYAYGGLFQELEAEDGVSVVIVSSPGQFIGSLVYPAGAGDFEREQNILGTLKRYGRPGDVVLLANLRVKRLCEQWGAVEDNAETRARETEPSRLAALKEGERLIAWLRQMNLEVVIDAPLPVFKAPPFRGSDWFNRINPVVRPGFSMDRDFLLEYRGRAMRSLHEAQTDIPALLIWDPFWALCPGTNCSAFDGTRPLFFDGDHLTGYGGRKLYPSFKAVLHKIWDNPAIKQGALPLPRPAMD